MLSSKIIMTPKVKISYILNVIIVLVSFTFGLRYIFASAPLNYQLEAIGVHGWNDIIPEYRNMITTFVRVAGVGMTTASIGMSIVLFRAFRYGQNWARWGFAGIFLAHYIPLMCNMFFLKTTTESNPPMIPNLIAISIVLLSLFFSSNLKNCKAIENK